MLCGLKTNTEKCTKIKPDYPDFACKHKNRQYIFCDEMRFPMKYKKIFNFYTSRYNSVAARENVSFNCAKPQERPALSALFQCVFCA